MNRETNRFKGLRDRVGFAALKDGEYDEIERSNVSNTRRPGK
jgi:hypothetical protein